MRIPDLNIDVVFLPDGSFYIGDGESVYSTIFFNAISYPNISEISTSEKDLLYLSSEDLRMIISLQYVLLCNNVDKYICDEISEIRRNCKYGYLYDEEELNVISKSKTTQVYCYNNIEFTADSIIIWMNKRQTMLFGIGGFLYSPGAVLSILASVSMSIDQGSDVDAISILLSMSSIVDDGKYNTIINVLSGSYVAWGVANENRATFRYSDDFLYRMVMLVLILW